LESSAFVQLVTPISNARDTETKLAAFSSLQLCSHAGNMRLQSQDDKLFVTKFLGNCPCYISMWLSKIGLIAKEKLMICGLRRDVFISCLAQ